MSGSPYRGALLLGTASLLWGVAFLPQSISVERLDAFWACALRFGLAAPVALLLARGRLQLGVPLRLAVLLGALLYVAFVLQTEALRHTQVARVSLITGMYAIFTPLLSPLFGLRRPGPLHFGGAGVALVGLGGLVGGFGAVRAPLNVGDLLTLGHALLSAVHMILVGKLAARAAPFALNAVQLSTMAALALPTALLVGQPLDASALDLRTGLALAYLAVFSSVVAFGFQLLGQRYASPSLCAVVFLMEAPIGALTAMTVLDERMSALQGLGALGLLCGMGLSLWAEVRAERSAKAL